MVLLKVSGGTETEPWWNARTGKSNAIASITTKPNGSGQSIVKDTLPGKTLSLSPALRPAIASAKAQHCPKTCRRCSWPLRLTARTGVPVAPSQNILFRGAAPEDTISRYPCQFEELD